MARSLLPHKRTREFVKDAPLWKNPYIFGIALSTLVLLVVFSYHFLREESVLIDKPSSSGKTSLFSSLFGKSYTSSKEPLELSEEEMDIIGIPKEQRKSFMALKPENFREKRRLFAMNKHQEIQKLGEERHQAIVLINEQRNSRVGQGLRDAIAAINESDNLGIMKLEGLLTNEMANPKTENSDSIIVGFISLGDVYAKKGMKQKAREAYLNALKLMKDTSQLESDQMFAQSFEELSKSDGQSLIPTSPGN